MFLALHKFVKIGYFEMAFLGSVVENNVQSFFAEEAKNSPKVSISRPS